MYGFGSGVADLIAKNVPKTIANVTDTLKALEFILCLV
jgi:hypothetical protein